MPYRRKVSTLLLDATFRPTGGTLLILFLAYGLIEILPESLKPPRIGALRLFWLWQIASIALHFAAYRRFSRQAHPTFFAETKQNLDKGFLLGITALLVWTIAYPFVMASWKPEAFIVRTSMEIATWCLMCAYLCVNWYTLRTLGARIAKNNSDEVDVRYHDLLCRTIVQVDLPCLIPFSIVLVYAWMNRTTIDWGTYLLGASAILLFISNTLSSALTALWETQ